jgi:tetratricopeptide (TPR) repeat protein
LQFALGNLGVLHAISGDFGKARDLFSQQLEHSQRLGDQKGLAIAWLNLGCSERDLGNPVAARSYLCRADGQCRQLGNEFILCNILSEQAELSMIEGSWDEALAINRQALEMAECAGRVQIVQECRRRHKSLVR